MQKTRILIADDHTMIVEAFRGLLEPQYEVIATVRDGRELLDVAPKVRPDVIVIDIGMPLLNGLAAGQRLKQTIGYQRKSGPVALKAVGQATLWVFRNLRIRRFG